MTSTAFAFDDGSNDDVRALIRVEARRLAPSLHEIVADGLTRSSKRLIGINRKEHPVLLPLLLRADIRGILDKRTLPEGWEVAGDPKLMEQLHFVNRALGIEQKFAKERRRTYPGGIRPAGHTHAGRRFYANPTFDLGPEFEAAPPATINLVLAWDLIGEEVEDGFTLRIAHPIAPGVYGRAVPTDLSIDLLPGGEIFDKQEFAGSADLGNIFDEIDLEAEEDDAGEQ